MRRRFLSAILAIGLASCGGKGATPTNPTPTPTITGLTIASTTDLMKIGQSETFTLTATMSDGTTRPATGTWRSDSPAVATVDSTGRVTGVASGETSISADSGNARATPRAIRVLPDYQGRWAGDWRVTSCTTDGDWARTDICRDVPVGSLPSLALALTQDRDNAAGTATLDDVTGPVQGPVRPGGQLNLGGAFTTTDEGIVLDITISDWETVTTDNQRMTGRFTLAFRAAGLQGSVRFGGELRIVGKTAPTPLAANAGGFRLHQAVTAAVRR